ncbi:Uncharacterised protein [uncultured Roseburia sp.]|uniref:DUF4405 domain-containing protein n=1 Tax=Brotonthovivens ammoniilytica TaxID=2981725 RepID=A0ABT2TN32_9FIRM|nr:DUF4405 domain-containing protein [Brotonthovivens ammoniilytica]MCU6763512.1 DUF4405 domain-containing protein [Brotonthovivens ammoniilytica]SCJ21964.1 Uncharacterised protein [uncultured Roseburia sp.]
MKWTSIIKISIDVAMYLLFLLLMGQYLLRDAPHEWLGVTAGILFILHNIFNYKWYTAIFKGRYNAIRIAQTAVNLLLLLTVFGCMLSGIFSSQYIFSVGNGGTIELGRFLHLVTTAWAFILMSVHLGLHWTNFIGIAQKITINPKTQIFFRWFFRLIVIFLCIYGVYLFIDRRFWEELFHLIDYQKEYDESKTFLIYLMESVIMSSLFTAVTYYIKKFALYKKQSHRKKTD